MPENWKTYKFEQLFDISSGLSKSRDQFGFGYPFVTFKDVFYNWFLPEKLGDLANTNEKEQSKGEVRKGDIILTRTSETLHELGMSSVALHNYPRSTFNGFCKKLRQKNDSSVEIEPIFMAYFLRSKYFRKEISKYATMTTRASLNIAAINSLTVNLPPYEEQRSIAAILKPLDTKIENNLAMNKTLEAMAMALYKHWFVDFGPFQDGHFIDSELGLIPEGWEVKPIGDLIETIGGGTPKTKVLDYWEGGTINWYSPTDLTRSNSLYSMGSAKQITPLGLQKSSAKLFPAGSLLMSSRATIGALAINRKEACTNQGFITMIPNDDVCVYQLHGWTVQNMGLILSKANGSTFKEISKTNFRSLPIVTGEKAEDYKSQVSSYYQKIENNLLEIESLTSLRDTLLPKLISGEVRVKDIEKTVSEIL